VLPGEWDASRLLRFLAGLAMLALAFTAPAALAPAEPVPAVSTVETAAETSVTLSESVPATTEVRATTVPSLPEGLPVLAATSFAVLLLGLAQLVRHTRAPPAV
jgi:hypothetical protein